MIEFNYETGFKLVNEEKTLSWISKVIISEGFEAGEIIYIFCDDSYLYNLNVEFLGHDTLTDIISFDGRIGNVLNGEIYISVERVLDNSKEFNTTFRQELHRVIIHGILHFCGYGDKTKAEINIMRNKEDKYLELFFF